MVGSIFSDVAKQNTKAGSDLRIDSFKERVALLQSLAEKAGTADAVIVTRKGDTATSVNSASLDLSKLDKEKLKSLNIDFGKLEKLAGGDNFLTSREILNRYGDFQGKFNKSGLKFTDISLQKASDATPIAEVKVNAQVEPLPNTNIKPQKPLAVLQPRVLIKPKTDIASVKTTTAATYANIQAMAARHGLKLANNPGQPIDMQRFVVTTYDIAAAKDKGIFAASAQNKNDKGSPLSVVVKDGNYSEVEAFMNEFRAAYLPKDSDGNPEKFKTLAVNSHGGTDGWLGDSNGKINWNLFPEIQDTNGNDASGLLKQSDHLYLAGCEVLSQIDDKDYAVIQKALTDSGTKLTANATYSNMESKTSNAGGGNTFTLDGKSIIKNPGPGDEETAENFQKDGIKYKQRLGGVTNTLNEKWVAGGSKIEIVR